MVVFSIIQTSLGLDPGIVSNIDGISLYQDKHGFFFFFFFFFSPYIHTYRPSIVVVLLPSLPPTAASEFR